MQTVHDGLKGLKSLFSSPKPVQKKLFNSSVQGSSIDIDSGVSSEGEFLCADCDKKFSTNEGAMHHMCNIHDKTSGVAEVNDVVESTETNDELFINEREENDGGDEPAEDVVNSDTEEIAMAEELERFAKLAETVSLQGSKCQSCAKGKEVNRDLSKGKADLPSKIR